MKIKLVNVYLAKQFLIKFLQITCGFSLLIFFINLLELFEKTKASDIDASPFLVACAMSFLKIPEFLNNVAPSIVLIASIVGFFLLSSKNEITILRNAGYSLWQIIMPISLSAFYLGIFWIIIFMPTSIVMTKKFYDLETRYIKKDMRETLQSPNGIWFKQDNLGLKNEEIIIQAKKVYQENLEFANVTFWFLNKNGSCYKKIDAKQATLNKEFWLVKEAVINDDKKINQTIEEIRIPTNLQNDFVTQKIINNFQNVEIFSVFELPKLVYELDKSGLSSTKFKIYFHSLLSKPILFLAMTLLACYFGVNNSRNKNGNLMIFLGVVIGLGFYVSSGVINSLGSSGLISIFASTWIITIICLAVGILLIYRKEIR